MRVNLKAKLKSLKDWYIGDNSKEKQRYLGRSLSLYPFICANICFIILLTLTILIPLFYFVLIPNRIQDSLAGDPMAETSIGAEGQRPRLRITSLDLKKVSNNSGWYSLQMSLPKITSLLPGSITLVGPTNFTIGTLSDFKSGIAFATLPDITASLGQETKLAFDGTFGVLDLPTVQSVLAGQNGGFEFILKTTWTIQWLGITWYKNLALQSVQKIAPKNSGVAFSKNSSPFPVPIRAPKLNEDIMKDFNDSSLINLGPGLSKIHLDTFHVGQQTTSSINFNATIYFENPTTTQLNCTLFSFILATANGSVPLVDISVLPQTPGLFSIQNQPFPDSRVMKLPSMITVSLRQPGPSFITSFLLLAQQLTESASIVGPFRLPTPDGDFFGLVTEKMRIDLPPDKVSKSIEFLAQLVTKQVIGRVLG